MKRAIKLHLPIHKPYLWVSLFCLALMSVAIPFCFFQKKLSTLIEQEQELNNLERRVRLTIGRHGNHKRYVERFAEADSQYISRYLEKMHFLEEEKKTLQILASQGGLVKQVELKPLLENQLRFAEVTRRKQKNYEEIELSQMQPVKMNLQDIKTFLSAVEGAPFSSIKTPKTRPQLLIKELILEKEKFFASKEIYSVKSQIIQRDIQ
ncbi:MAG: hypothetical protein SNF33_03880 [Candidatus Algichlamydia australiensis]|nr:hypothetical protein [Chlamydiales bacterium]